MHDERGALAAFQRWLGVLADLAGRVEPRELGILVHGLEVHDPRFEDAHTIECLRDGLVDHETRKGPRREEVLAPKTYRDALPNRARIGRDHLALEEGERRQLCRLASRMTDLSALDL